MAEEEIVNPKPEIEEACRPQCVKALLAYEQCAARIADDQTGEAHCTGQYFDMLQVWRLSFSLFFLAVTAVRLCDCHRIICCCSLIPARSTVPRSLRGSEAFREAQMMI